MVFQHSDTCGINKLKFTLYAIYGRCAWRYVDCASLMLRRGRRRSHKTPDCQNSTTNGSTNGEPVCRGRVPDPPADLQSH